MIALPTPLMATPTLGPAWRGLIPRKWLVTVVIPVLACPWEPEAALATAPSISRWYATWIKAVRSHRLTMISTADLALGRPAAPRTTLASTYKRRETIAIYRAFSRPAAGRRRWTPRQVQVTAPGPACIFTVAKSYLLSAA